MGKNGTSQIVEGHGGPGDYTRYCNYVTMYVCTTRVFCTYRSTGDRYCTYKIVSMCFSGNSSVGYLGGCVLGRSAQHLNCPPSM